MGWWKCLFSSSQVCQHENLFPWKVLQCNSDVRNISYQDHINYLLKEKGMLESATSYYHVDALYWNSCTDQIQRTFAARINLCINVWWSRLKKQQASRIIQVIPLVLVDKNKWNCKWIHVYCAELCCLVQKLIKKRTDIGLPAVHLSQELGSSMASTTYAGKLRNRLRQKGNVQQLAKQKVLQAKMDMQARGLRRRDLQARRGHRARPPKLRAEVEPQPLIMEKIPACAAPKFVVRPAPANPPPAFVVMETDEKHPINRDDWMNIFKFLDKTSLNECMAVCKTWNRWCIHPSLWKRINLSRISPISKSALCGIVRRQPVSLDLSWTNITGKQLSWLLPRLPNLKGLSLGGSTWPVVHSLSSVVCPFLTSLDLQWVSALNDSSLLSLLSPPMDHRPGYFDERSRLCNLETLCLAGSDITDATMSTIVQYTPLLGHLDVSFCGNLTDASIRILLDEKSPVRMSLKGGTSIRTV